MACFGKYWEGSVERVMGIEPTSSAWEAEVMPLYDTRAKRIISNRARSLSCVQRKSIHIEPLGQNSRSLIYCFGVI